MPTSQEIAESLRKAPRRGDLLLGLDAMKVAHVGQLADVLGITWHRVEWMMNGNRPYYRPERCLVPLELAEPVVVPRGRVYAITPLGTRVAGSLRFQRSMDGRHREARLRQLRRAAMV